MLAKIAERIGFAPIPASTIDVLQNQGLGSTTAACYITRQWASIHLYNRSILNWNS